MGRKKGYKLGELSGTNLKCKICGKIFYSRPSNRAVTCGTKCGYLWKKQKYGQDKKCPICGKIFHVANCVASKKHCSMKCKLIGIKKNPTISSNYKGGKYIKCNFCEKKVWVTPCKLKTVGKTYCSTTCYLTDPESPNRQYGSRNAAWLGGKSFEPYTPEFNPKLKNFIRKRDSYRCSMCGKNEKETGERMSIHHVDYNKKNNSHNNLISLCRICHTHTNLDREKWTKLFREIFVFIGEDR